MNKSFYFLPLFLVPVFLVAQDYLYKDIEVWGIEDSARDYFFARHEQQELPICAASLKILGYPHGNRILLEDGRQILTLRNYPNLPWEESMSPKRPVPTSEVWEDVLQLDVFSIETQLTHLYYPAFLQQDTSAFTLLFEEHQQQFRLYGFGEDVEEMVEYCSILQQTSRSVGLSEVMEILTTADSASIKLKLAAGFLLPALVHTDEEAIALLPFLFDEDANRIQHALRYYFLMSDKEVDWSPVLPTLAVVFSHPDPLIVMDMIEILDQTGFQPGWAPSLLVHGATTLQEILESDFTTEWKQEIISFLEANDIVDPGSTSEECLSVLKSHRR